MAIKWTINNTVLQVRHQKFWSCYSVVNRRWKSSEPTCCRVEYTLFISSISLPLKLLGMLLKVAYTIILRQKGGELPSV